MTSREHRTVVRARSALALLAFINLLNYLDRNIIFALFESIKRDLLLNGRRCAIDRSDELRNRGPPRAAMCGLLARAPDPGSTEHHDDPIRHRSGQGGMSRRRRGDAISAARAHA